MVKHRSHSIEFKRQVAQEFIAGETLHGLAQRHDLSRNLIRIWVAKDEDDGIWRPGNRPTVPIPSGRSTLGTDAGEP